MYFSFNIINNYVWKREEQHVLMHFLSSLSIIDRENCKICCNLLILHYRLKACCFLSGFEKKIVQIRLKHAIFYRGIRVANLFRPLIMKLYRQDRWASLCIVYNKFKLGDLIKNSCRCVAIYTTLTLVQLYRLWSSAYIVLSLYI